MKKKIFLVVLFIFVLSLLPSLYRTAKFANDAQGLISIATADSTKASWNPYAKDTLMLSPDLAVWVLENMDFPYSRCSTLSETLDVCDAPLVTMAGRTIGMYGPESERRALQLLNYFITKGEGIDKLYQGLAPVHEAVLYKQEKYLEILLASGVNLETKIEQPGKTIDGQNVFEFLETLEAKGNADYSQIRKMLYLLK